MIAFAKSLLHYIVRFSQENAPLVMNLAAELTKVEAASVIDQDSLNDQIKQILVQASICW